MSANYTYSVVSHNGAGVMAQGFKRCADAKRAAERIAARGSSVKLGPFEIERVEHLGYGRRYWMRQRSRWVLRRHDRDIEDRKPDWIYIEPDAHDVAVLREALGIRPTDSSSPA